MTKRKEKHKSSKDFKTMSKNEKKHFLSMDLIERMIRIEQRVSSSFRKDVDYDKTEYYKSLSNDEKTEFSNYLKRKKGKQILKTLFIAVPLLFLASLELGLTGNVVDEAIGEQNIPLLEIGLLLFSIAICTFFIMLFLSKKIKNARFERHFDVVESIFSRKHKIRRTLTR